MFRREDGGVADWEFGLVAVSKGYGEMFGPEVRLVPSIIPLSFAPSLGVLTSSVAEIPDRPFFCGSVAAKSLGSLAFTRGGSRVELAAFLSSWLSHLFHSETRPCHLLATAHLVRTSRRNSRSKSFITLSSQTESPPHTVLPPQGPFHPLIQTKQTLIALCQSASTPPHTSLDGRRMSPGGRFERERRETCQLTFAPVFCG